MNKTLLFLFGCFHARLLLAYIAKNMSLYYLRIFSIIPFIIGIMFIKNYINKEPNAWWSNYRLIHGINFLFFSVTAFLQYKNAWLILLCDAILGLIFFTYEQLNSNSANNLQKTKKVTSKE